VNRPASLPVCAPMDLPSLAPQRRWLAEGLWPAGGVGIIGGAPKSLKTFLALDLAVSVATGTPCIGAFACSRPGPTLVYAAEDNLPDLRQRLAGAARCRGLELRGLDLGVITCDHLHLDRDEHLGMLDETLARHRPVLLVLDPFVRLHRGVDENSSADVSRILGALRTLQRRHDTAIALVHHARKNVSGLRFGQALRGSGDFYAWGDVTLYLHRDRDGVLLTVEHRSAAAPEPMRIELDGHPQPALKLVSGPALTEAVTDLGTRILEVLRQQAEPLSQNKLREQVRARKADVAGALKSLQANESIQHTPKGWLVLDRQTSLLER